MDCQSCGMPLRKKEDFGTNADGSKSNEYCFHCFQNGKFLDEGITLQDKIKKMSDLQFRWECQKMKLEEWFLKFCQS